jgi:NAD(P)-dependent dehydrogenase (short-subunit alcohol dehydrogenase family)
MDFGNRNVIVTGAAGALGGAVVRLLLAAGARCRIPLYHTSTAGAFPATPRIVEVPHGDLSNEADVARLYEGVDDLWASIHIAGGFAMGAIAQTGKADLARMLEVNLVSCYLCCAAAVRTIGPSGGRIVNVAARAALEPRAGAGMSAYTASKAAVAALTQSVAAEVASRNILVNAVAPSIIDTPPNRAGMPKADFDQWPTPEQIAATIAFLASPDNLATSGAVVPVYGRA